MRVFRHFLRIEHIGSAINIAYRYNRRCNSLVTALKTG